MNTARLLKTDLGYLDYVLVPVMVIFPGLVGYAAWRNAKKAR